MLFKYKLKNKVSNIFVPISSSTEKIKTHANSVLRFEILLKQSPEPKTISFLGSVDYDDSKLETEFACLLIFGVFGLDIITLFLR